ncbi:KN motif and ankyrin repeat domain-containing protein 3-like [Anolis carolinensis]|uniref:KN motif and ankyrin repeat domain-containing protein 3-like n=1 Tax=Anolis carolinensis TaxID=28377 RepID=UPI002F2B863A
MAQTSPLDSHLAGGRETHYSVETPYGFLLDLDFVKYVEEIESGVTLRKAKGVRGVRGHGRTGGWASAESIWGDAPEDVPVSVRTLESDGHEVDNGRSPSSNPAVTRPETHEAESWVTEVMLGLSSEAEEERRLLQDTVQHQKAVIALLENHLRDAADELEELRVAVAGWGGRAGVGAGVQVDLRPDTADQGVQHCPEVASVGVGGAGRTEDDPEGGGAQRAATPEEEEEEEEEVSGVIRAEEGPEPNTGTAPKSIMKRHGLPATAERKTLQFVGFLNGEYESTSSSEEEEEEEEEEATRQSTLETAWFGASSRKDSSAEEVSVLLGSLSPDTRRRLLGLSDADGNTALHYSLSYGNFGIAQLLLDTGFCHVDRPNKAGYTALMLAALAPVRREEEMDVVRRVFRLGNVNARAGQAGPTALMLAVSHGRQDVAEALLDAGADPHLPDEEDDTCQSHSQTPSDHSLDGQVAIQDPPDNGNVPIIIIIDAPDDQTTPQGHENGKTPCGE